MSEIISENSVNISKNSVNSSVSSFVRNVCKKDGIGLFHVNIQCISNKLEEISLFLDNTNFDIVCFSEHWQDNVTINSFTIPHFTLAAHFCRNTNKHGGVAIFVKNTVKYKQLQVNEFCSQLNAEFCAIEILNINCVLINVYRSPTGDINTFLDLLEQLLIHCSTKFSKIILVGDFNVNFRGASPALSELVCLTSSFGLEVTISEYTRITSHTMTCIDNILTNLADDYYETGVIDPCLSDHLGQFINIKVHKNDSSHIWRRNIGSKGIDKLKVSLNNIDWSLFNKNLNYKANFLAEFLVNTFSSLIESHFPLKKCKINHNPPVQWFNDSLRNMRDRLSCIKTISNCTRDFNLYNTLKKDYKSKVVEAKKTAYDNFINSSDNKARDSWKLINFERKKSTSNSPEHNISPESFNMYFTTIAEHCIKSLPTSNVSATDYLQKLPNYKSSFFLEPVSAYEVAEAVKNLKDSNCTDIYGINSRILKETIDLILLPLTILINACISEGHFPDVLKVAKVLPLFKKGDINTIDNYRPISIIPIFAKILEIILKKRLVNYLETYNILNCCQFGFRNKCSTTKAVFKIVSDIVEGLEDGKHVAVSLCDLSKAFDCVAHELLVEKLSFYGIRGLPLDLFNSYLNNRQQCVAIDNFNSELLTIRHGVPQGSVLGPILFILYLNDFFHFMSPIKCFAYADDTSILDFNSNIKNLNCDSISSVHQASDWFSSNNLKLNEDKTQRLVFSTSNLLVKGDSIKILGVILDDTLSWFNHVEILSNKLSSIIFLLRRLKNILCFSTLRNCYFSLFHSHINYAILLWGGSSHAIKIFRLQKRAVRLIDNAGWRDHCQPIFKKLGIMPVPCLFMYITLLEIHKNIGSFSTNSDFHNYDTRAATQLRQTRFRLTKSIKNTLNLQLYNHIPNDLKSLNFNSFKYKMKRHFLKHCFYSVDEFFSTQF